ncbi:MAG: Mth938-like domain-containing protein [Beijerinckiaceae bacterium]
MAGRPRYDGFVPGQFAIDGYGAGGFTFAGMSHRGSILALPSGIHAWKVAVFEELSPEALGPVFAEAEGSVELLLIGTGKELRPLPRDVREALRARSIRFDPMATTHAVSTYNILLEERRKVAAALIATD